MRIIFWNIKGLGKSHRRNWVKEHIILEDLDIVALQETIKHDFSDYELKRDGWTY
jgi:exonuclease III